MEDSSDPNSYYYEYSNEETPVVDFLILAAIKSAATSLGSPMEVSKILLQVQRVPKGGSATRGSLTGEGVFSDKDGKVVLTGQLNTMSYLNGAVGFSSLFRGNLANCARAICSSVIDDRVHDFLLDNFVHLEDETLPIFAQPNYKSAILAIGFSHGLTGLVMSPFEVVQVRYVDVKDNFS